MTVVWFRFLFRQLRKLVSFRSQHRFPQPAQVSATILLKAMLQVSHGETGHMGKLQVTCTWNVSPQFSQITHKRSWSTRVKGKAKQGILRWHVSVLLTWRFAWHDPQLTKILAHLEIKPVNWIQQPPLRGFNWHDDHHARSRAVEIYVSLWQRSWQCRI